MRVSTSISVALLACAAAAGASPLESRAAKCTDFFIPVQAKASNRLIFLPNLDLTSIAGVTSLLSSAVGAVGQLTGFVPVSGTYQISGRYCAPTATPKSAPASRSKTLQVLLHGIPYNKDYWSGLHFPNDASRYSWVEYATSQGYPVLAIDNLGSGNSTKADPVLVVQQSLETEILHEIITMARRGKLQGVPQAEKVVFVGHSIGSVTGNGLATKYPHSAFDAAILTGYTYSILPAAIGLLTDAIVPASLQNAQRFGDLSPAYLTFASVDGKRNTYYSDGGEFDAALPPFDVAQAQGTLTVGELVSILSGLQKAPDFTGDVFVITGDQDAIVCSVGSNTLAKPDCGTGADSLPAKSKALWPKANYDYYIPVGGHAITLHYSAQEQFRRAHEFLAKSGY